MLFGATRQKPRIAEVFSVGSLSILSERHQFFIIASSDSFDSASGWRSEILPRQAAKFCANPLFSFGSFISATIFKAVGYRYGLIACLMMRALCVSSQLK